MDYLKCKLVIRLNKKNWTRINDFKQNLLFLQLNQLFTDIFVKHRFRGSFKNKQP